MDYKSQLSRFINRRVCVELWSRITMYGRLVSVHYDHLRFADTVILGELEGQDWFERMRYGEGDEEEGGGGGPRNAETIVRLDVVLHLSCADDVPLHEDPDSNVADPESENDIFACAPIEPSLEPSSPSAAEHAASRHRVPSEMLLDEPDYTARFDRLEIELGRGLLPMVIPDRCGDLLNRISMVRKQIATEKGVIIPRTRIRDRLEFSPRAYRIRMNGHVIATGELVSDRLLAMNLGQSLSEVEGIQAVEPLRGLPAKWIEPTSRDYVVTQGGVVAEPAVVLLTHFAHAVQNRLHELIGYQDVLRLIEILQEENRDAISELIPSQVSVSTLHEVLKNLLEEQVSIRHLMKIIESVGYHSNFLRDPSLLLEHVRVDMGRDICAPYLASDGTLSVTVVDPGVEHSIRQTISDGGDLIHNNCIMELAQYLTSADSSKPILVELASIRRPLFSALSRHLQTVAVLSYNELPRDIKVTSVTASTA